MNNAKSFEEKVMLSKMADGDQLAFRQFFDLYKEKLFTFVYGLTHSKVDAEEVLQDVFLKLWEAGALLKNVDNPQAYIFRMTRNRTLDLLSRIGRDQNLIKQIWANISLSEDFTDQILQARESQKLIREAMTRLTDKQRKIVELSREEGLSHDEIANKLGLSKQTVKNHLSESLKKIRLYLNQHSHLLSIIFWIHYCEVFFRKF